MVQTSSKIIRIAVFIIVFSSYLYSQDMKKPDPVKNETINMILGTWVADPYDMMGSKWSETSTQHIELNGQFMYLDVTGSDNMGTTYTGHIVFKLNKDDTFTGWSFDDWGQVGTYTGTTSINKMTINGK